MLNRCFLKFKKGYSETQEEEITASCKLKAISLVTMEDILTGNNHGLSV